MLLGDGLEVCILAGGDDLYVFFVLHVGWTVEQIMYRVVHLLTVLEVTGR